jgi:hypothetical protein
MRRHFVRFSCATALLAAAVLFAGAAFAQEPPRAIDCPVSNDIRRRALELTWDEFDQKSESPASFRVFALRGCYRAAAELIEYYLANKPGLDAAQQRILRFHAGQMYGHAGDERRALELIRSAYWLEQPADAPLDWNTYVSGVVAFLEKDRGALASARERLEKAGGRNLINARVLRRMEKCFNQPYNDVWAPACDVA